MLERRAIVPEAPFWERWCRSGSAISRLHDEVGDYSAGFPEDDAGVGILDC